MEQSNVILEQMQLGPMQNYVYFIGCGQTKQVAVVDPGWDVDLIQQNALKNNYQITAILLTHGHPDHIEGVADLQKLYSVPVYLSKHEAFFYQPDCKDLRLTADKEIITIGNITIECLHTPGHTPGCQCFRAGDILLTGDVLFVHGCGRCDLPGGNPKIMYHSLYDVILKLPDTTVVYPGHDYGHQPFAPLGELRKSNPYLTCKNMQEFIDERM